MTPPRDAGGARTLPRPYLTDPATFELESRRIFATHWLASGREEETPHVGDLRRWRDGEEQWLVVRGDDGRLRCLANLCRHRGTLLCDRESQSGRSSLVCPYHGWTYALDGELRGAPNMRDVPGFSVADWPLRRLRLETWLGLAMVCRDPGAVPPAEQFASLTRRLAPWGMEHLRSAASLHYDVAANWKLIFQNYNECYHCPRVHPQLNQKTDYRTAQNDHRQGPVLGGPMELEPGVQTMSRDGRYCGRPLRGLAEPLLRQVFYYSVFPTLLISPHPDYVMVHQVRRQAVDRTRVTCEFLFPAEVVSEPGFDPEPVVSFWDQVNREDWQVCEWSQQGASSPQYEPGPYSNLESNLAAWDRHYLETLGETP